MNKERASHILAASIEAQTKINILKIAKAVIDKFKISRPELGEKITLSLELNITTDLLFEIEDYLITETNGRKKRKRIIKKRR